MASNNISENEYRFVSALGNMFFFGVIMFIGACIYGINKFGLSHIITELGKLF